MRARGVPDADVAAEVADWRRNGWLPPSTFTLDVLDAVVAARVSPMTADSLLRPWARRLGPEVCAEALARVEASRRSARD